MMIAVNNQSATITEYHIGKHELQEKEEWWLRNVYESGHRPGAAKATCKFDQSIHHHSAESRGLMAFCG